MTVEEFQAAMKAQGVPRMATSIDEAQALLANQMARYTGDIALFERWEGLATAGLIVSIARGPRKAQQGALIWTVALMHSETGLEAHAPFQACDFQHCIEIAEIEGQKLLRAAATLRRAGDPP